MCEHIGYMSNKTTLPAGTANAVGVGTTASTSAYAASTSANTTGTYILLELENSTIGPMTFTVPYMSTESDETPLKDLVYKVLQAQGILLKEIVELKEEIASIRNEYSNNRPDGQRKNNL